MVSYASSTRRFPAFHINASGQTIFDPNVGIGVDSPVTPLHVSGSIRASAAAALGSFAQIGHDGANALFVVGGPGSLGLQVGGADRITVDSDGGVGMPALPIADPAITGNLWVDTADAFTVKMSS